MSSVVEQYKEKKRTAPDHGEPGTEWDIVKGLLIDPPAEIDAILEWIFTLHKGYVEPRSQAGLKYLERNPAQGWRCLEQLMRSDDPDDRDTALSVLQGTGEISWFYLAEPLLKDQYAYLRFEAAELLMEICPEEVKSTLRELAGHESGWVQDEARWLLTKMDQAR